ncbi:hypothetical protein A7J50_2521 [Pseudomonas antarctica]|uniref:Uncharacterized protein n=1 Tax=Pseudomonas antarctica TaxID=219572 RepID=A0A172Z0I6_9PSED|nr:hypothetical protein A7J50_2521 [Pseudomonas antarctica]
MRRLVILDGLKTAAQIKLRGLWCIGEQAHGLKMNRCVVQQLFYQGLCDTTASHRGRHVYPAQSTDSRAGVWVAGHAADGNQLAVTKDAQQALTGLIKSIGAVFPFGDKPRQEPETFGNGLRFQYVDLLGEFAQRVYRNVFAGLYHSYSPLNQTALGSAQQETVVSQPLATVD